MFFKLIYSLLWLYLNKARAIFFLGTIAEKSFRNLRNKYRRDKRKWKVTNRSGAGAGEVKRQYIIDSLGWLEPYFIGRETDSNWETNRYETLVQEDDAEEQEEDDDNLSVGSVESNKSVVVINPKISAHSSNSAKKSYNFVCRRQITIHKKKQKES